MVLVLVKIIMEKTIWFQENCFSICIPGDGFVCWCDRVSVRAWLCLQRSEKHNRNISFSLYFGSEPSIFSRFHMPYTSYVLAFGRLHIHMVPQYGYQPTVSPNGLNYYTTTQRLNKFRRCVGIMVL